MTLYDEMLEDFVYLDKAHTPDGEGGSSTTWVEGAKFKAVATADSTLEAVVAGIAKGTVVFAFHTPLNVSLEYGDVVKRLSDGQYFRINAVGATPPKSSTIDLRKNQAISWELPL